MDGESVSLPADTLPMTIYLEPGGHADNPDELISMMLEGTAIPMCSTSEMNGDESGRYYVAREIAGAWATQNAGAKVAVSPWPELFDPGWAAFKTLPENEQQDRIVKFRTEAPRCDGTDLYADLTGLGDPA